MHLLSLLVATLIQFSIAVNVTFTFQGSATTICGLKKAQGNAFLGIPFAAPPVGQLRFKPAQLVKLPRRIDATKEKPPCSFHEGRGSEDCLYLNIYTPANSNIQTANLPVYVFIHGAGASAHLPDGLYNNLVNRGPLILVSIDYREGVFGYFTTRDSISPGNQALTDWIAALQWVQSYIRFFGGDPAKVTIGGESLGGFAVSALTLTRKADGLFRAVIMESGAVFAPTFTYQSDTKRNSSMVTAVGAGCATSSQWNQHNPVENQKIITCLRAKSTTELLAINDEVIDATRWGLVQDGFYLTDRLENLALQRRPMPVMHGVNNMEGLNIVVENIIANNMSIFTRKYLADNLQSSYQISMWNNQDQVFNAAKRLYIDSAPIAENDHVLWCLRLIEMWQEMLTVGPVKRDAKYFATTGSNVYLYSVDTYPLFINQLVKDFLKPLTAQIPEPRLRGVAHTLELNFIFDYSSDNDNVTLTQGTDLIMKENMGKLWTNFIVTGNPTPKTGGISLPFTWEPASNNYLSIAAPIPAMLQNFYPRASFWMCNATAIDGVAPPFC